jgi:hypothetical protein
MRSGKTAVEPGFPPHPFIYLEIVQPAITKLSGNPGLQVQPLPPLFLVAATAPDAGFVLCLLYFPTTAPAIRTEEIIGLPPGVGGTLSVLLHTKFPYLEESAVILSRASIQFAKLALVFLQ